MPPPEAQRPGRYPRASKTDLLGEAAISAEAITNASAASTRLVLEAHTAARLDMILVELVHDPEAQRALESVFERVTLPLIDRLAAAAERGRCPAPTPLASSATPGRAGPGAT
jgi:hypothetical protein